MRFVHSDHDGRTVRLAYCMNLHAGETLPEVRAGIERITLPLRERLAQGAPFGVGAYFPNTVAAALAAPSGAGELADLASWLADEGLEAFTFNAFPFGGFHEDGLKEAVYRPTWAVAERADYTLAVAHIAAALNGARDGHVSISTHPGAYGEWIETPRDLMACATGMSGVVERLASLERAGGPRVVLSLEAEPRASAGNSAELAEFLVVARHRAEQALSAGGHTDHGALAARHLGTCIDCCHAAVEFEDPSETVRLATLGGGALGKVQFSSALSLARPVEHPAGRAALLALDEPRYLHQVRGGDADGARESASDLPVLAAELEADAGAWLSCDEWRCHFHVPVDLDETLGLGTTRDHADGVLDALLARPDGWTSSELHLEIETYTWDVLPGAARGAGDLVDGLEREYAHVIGRLERAGWRRD